MKDILEEKLKQRNIKPTAIRLLVLKQLTKSGTAISLSDLEARFERADTATLYRTLKTFEERKLIHSIQDGTGAVKYALCTEECECELQDQHTHFHCVKCGATFCLVDSKIPKTKIPAGFQASSVSMVYKGFCSDCNKSLKTIGYKS
jgi:Fur family ferric uptake transcriptional regulator